MTCIGQIGRGVLEVTNSVYCSSYSALRFHAAAVSTTAASDKTAQQAKKSRRALTKG